MGSDESTLFIERDCQRTLTCSNLQNRMAPCVSPCKERNQRLAVAFSLLCRGNRDVLDFKNPGSFIRNNAFRLHAAILKHIQGAPFKITVDHILLFIRQEQQREEMLFVLLDFTYSHSSINSRIRMGRARSAEVKYVNKL